MDIENYATRLERKKHFLDRITPDLWFDASTGNTLTASEVVRSYGSFDEGIAKKYPWLIELKNSISVSFIKTQRLEARKFFTSPPWHPERRRKNNSVINLCAEKMKGIVATALSDYGKISQNLDQSFPNRLLEKNTPTFSKSDLKLKMNSIEEFREKLKEIKLLGEENSIIYDKIDIDELSDTHLKVLSTYVDDTQKKLDTLRSLSRKVEVMLNKINKKFNHKKLEIDPEFGISVFDKDNKRLCLDVLSSGEQHEIVLVFDLLFNSPDGALILIDEPEISLHISWQREFLDDLMDIVQLNNMEVIIATHSPNIIDKHYDLMVELSSKIKG